MGARIDETTGAQVRRWRDEAGAISGELVSVIVVVSAVIAALLAIPIAPTVADWGRYAVCTLFGNDGCEHPEARHDLLATPDLSECQVLRRSGAFQYDVSAVVSYENRVGFDTTLLGDGNVEVTYERGESIGAGAGVGGEVWVYTGDEEFGAGAVASADITLFGSTGDVYGFPDLESAEAWVSWHRANAGIADALPGVGSDTPVLGWTMGKGHEAVNGALNLGRFIPGRSEGFGQQKPPDPEVISTWHEGGLELSGRAGFGAGGRGGELSDEYVGADVEALASAATRHQVDHRTGETTIVFTDDAWIEGSAALANFVAEGTAGGTSIISLTLDADGNPVRLQTHAMRLDEAGRDFEGATDLDTIDRRFGTASADGEAGLTDPSMYEISTTLDFVEHPELVDAVLGSNPARTANNREIAAALEQSLTTVTEYDPSSQRYGGLANIEPILGDVGLGASYERSESELRNAWVYDPARDRVYRWATCMDARS